MNDSALTQRYTNGIPEELSDGVQMFKKLSQKRGITSVKLMSNFGKDLEQSLKAGTDIYKGVIVQTTPHYELSVADKLWLHPELTKARRLFNGKSNMDASKLGEFNSSVGTYSTYSVDELGGQKTTNYTIEDTASNMSAVVNHWMASRVTMRDAYADFKKSKPAVPEPSLTTEYVSFFKGASSFHYYNHAIKSDGEALVLQSPLMGYVKVNQEGDIASDTMSGFLEVNKLSEAHLERAFNDCSWEGNSLVNTFTMRKGEAISGEAFRMVKGVYSSNNIQNKLDLATLLKLTPKKENIPASVKCHESARKDVISVEAGEEMVQKVMKKHWKTLISKKYLVDNQLMLPRKLLDTLV